MKSGRTIKCMMVGDTGVGKTCAVEMFTKKNAVENCTPTAKLMKYQNDLSIDNEKVSLEIWDTPGEDDYICLRKTCYPLTDVILLVFNMVDRKSQILNYKDRQSPRIQKLIRQIHVLIFDSGG